MKHAILPEEAFTYFEAKGAVFIDVRSRSEYNGGHIPGAINIDIYGPHFETEILKFDRETTYILNCQTGMRSGCATEYMLEKGFKDPRNLVGGFSRWRGQGLPFEKGS